MTLKSCVSAGILLAVSLSWSVPVVAQSPASPAQDAALQERSEDDFSAIITPEDVFNHIYFLASDALRGRDTPSAGLEAAAAYLVSEHRRMGLEPAGEDDTFYQRFPFQLQGVGAGDVEVTLGEERLRLGEDFFLSGGSAEPIRGSVALLAGEYPTDETPNLNGSAAAVFPLQGPWGQELMVRADQQAGLAEQAGVKAAVHVLDGAFPEQGVAQAAEALAQPRWMLGDDPPFPQIFLTRDAAERALANSAGTLEDFLARHPEGAPFQSAVAELTLDAELPLNTVQTAYPPNVIAKIPGSDPELRDEYIVLSAHFDHVGVGQPMEGDSIYNGADDNASGTTALLEVARALRSLPEAPRRTVVFAHVSAEEKGLLGSEWFVDNPTIPIENVVANINADMVGSDTHADTVVIIGKEYSTLGELVEEVNSGLPELGLVASPDLWPEQRLFYRSDQYNFMRKEIPSLFFFTGLHECYHQPCDTPDFVDPDKAARIARLIAHTVVEIANRDERPEWYPEGLEEVRQMTGAGR